MICDILNPIHAKLTGFKYKAFLKRFDTISEKGAWRTVKVDYADKDKFSTEEIRENKKRLEREARARREMSSYFLSQITL